MIFLADMNSHDPSYLIMDAVKEGMSPFRFESVQLWMDRDFRSFDKYVVSACVDLYDGDSIITMEPLSSEDLDSDPEQALYDVARRFFRAFRKREGLEIGPLIELGEN